MDLLTLLDTWWFRLITLPIDIAICYYLYKWILKKFPSLKKGLWYDEKKWKNAEMHEKKIINFIKSPFVKKEKKGPFI